MFKTTVFSVAMMLAASGLAAAQQPREDKVRADKKKVEADGFWIYNDLERGLAEAKKTGKPLLVALRCIPCVECVKLDDDLVNQDRRVRPLLEKFVCVRIVSTNGLDLTLFQFDYDQSFAAFLLNSDGTIYGRFGSRSHRSLWADDVSIDGLSRALQGALEIHEQYPKNRDALAGKKGPAPEFPTPEKYPQLKARYGPKLNYEGNVAQSCIHCHQVGDAQKTLARTRKEPMPEQLLFPYPHPKALGLILDPKEKATVLRVDKDSPAEQAGFEKGDIIRTLEGQPLVSIADVQWVLHNAPADGATVKAEVRRGDRDIQVALKLSKGWRQRDDISWRSSTWGLRRMATGGLSFETLPDNERKAAGAPETGMALRIKHVGMYGPHAAAHNAGFRKGDIVIDFDGRDDLTRESELMAHALSAHRPGERVKVTLIRDKKKLELTLPMQE